MIPIAKPLIGEEEKQAVLEVLDSGNLAQGPRVAAFEAAFAEYCGTNFAVATSSGTTALYLALLAHGLGPGDEVITSPFTFIASANSILFVGATPVFADIDPATFNIDPVSVARKITPRTKAIMPVHLYGQPAALEPLLALAREHNLVVIEDAAQSHGATYQGQKAGSFGTGCFSFYPTKNITSGEGGMITTNAPEIAERCKLLRAHGMKRRYYHDEIGYNFRMTDIHAAIGLAQLAKLDGWNEQRRQNAAFLTAHLDLPGLVPPAVAPQTTHVYHQYTIRALDGRRDALIAALEANEIGYGVYYPVPVHAQKPYLNRGLVGSLPVSEAASLEALSLPVHPSLSRADLEQIVAVLSEFARSLPAKSEARL